MCCGRLPHPEDHDGTDNTHRLCMDTTETGHGIFDLKINRTDAWWISLLLERVKEDCDKGTANDQGMP